MIDPNLAILTWLQASPDLAALVGTNIFSPVLPEGFSAMASTAPDPAQRAVVVRKRGGRSQPEIPEVLDPSFAIECWAMEAPDATQIYGIIRDLMHGATSINLGSAGFVILAQEEVPGQDLIDPETHFAMVVAYYHVKLRSSGGALYVPPFSQGPLAGIWYYHEGYGAPATLQTNGDFYLNLSTGDIYLQASGSWGVPVGNILGGGGGGGSEVPSLTYHKVAASGTNAASIKAAPGIVTGWKIYNDTEYPIYVKLFNEAATPAPGTDTPQQTIGVDAGVGEVNPAGPGIVYSAGIGIAITKGILDNDSTPVAAGDCVVDLFYQ
jgi:hypothetical protein